MNKVAFLEAKPVWPVGRQLEMNCQVGFTAVLNCSEAIPAIIRIAASSIYRLMINGEFVGHGPARGPHGYYRIDEWPMGVFLHRGLNLIAIEAVGYNVNSYYLLDQPAFVQAEIVYGDRILNATGKVDASFTAYLLPERVQKVQRFSFQRPFCEVYRLSPGSDRWKRDIDYSGEPVAVEICEQKNTLSRRVPLPEWNCRQPLWQTANGKMVPATGEPKAWRDRSLTQIGELLKGYTTEELDATPIQDLEKLQSVFDKVLLTRFDGEKAIEFSAGEFRIIDFATNLTGFLGIEVVLSEPGRLYLTFDEITKADGDIDFNRLDCANTVMLDCQPGRYSFETLEPYTLRYLKIFLLSGSGKIEQLYLREYVNTESTKSCFACSDPQTNSIFAAAAETFRQNAVDIFMDCPSRERAGWLCDSFFTARTARTLTGNCAIETNQFENFLLPEKFPYLPEGMLPMCYPADQRDGRFIPQWAMWFILQLREYRERGGDPELIQALKKRVLALFAYLDRFRNSDGLLERLDSWNFVEWSMANEFVMDVNYPTNMLFTGVLEAAAELYDIPALATEAAKLRKIIATQSYDGDFFVDNGVRKGDAVVATRNRSEVCQYYAFFFRVATPESHKKLWNILVNRFGPERKKTGLFPDIHPANAFIGHIMRVELLARAGLCKQLHEEITGYYGFMAEKTGTLWEFDDLRASCNHGFASHIAHVYLRDLLGIAEIDYPGRRIVVKSSDVKLMWCKGRIPVNNSWLQVEWQRKDNRQEMRVVVPFGFRLEIQPDSHNLLLVP
ncbi:MAG TPA: hypothetical protein PKN04_12115 [bacterium]|jgi:alpha-L-rhamnosidase|nr:hypothetical protein [bacterium]